MMDDKDIEEYHNIGKLGYKSGIRSLLTQSLKER